MTNFTVQNCPLCDSTQSHLFDQRDFHGEQVTNRICANCGLVFQSPRMSDEQLDAFYEQEYRQLYQGSQDPSAKDLDVQRQRAEALLSFTRVNRAVFTHHLDIGCSAGVLLKCFQDAFKSQPTGIEPGKAYRIYAQRQGLRVYASLEGLQSAAITKFDLISMIHVLEHIPDPVTYLAHIRQQFLSPSGWLLVEVPNLYAHDCFEVAHLVAYSPHTLGQMLGKAGYTIHALQEHGKPRSSLIPLYITVLARPLNPESDFVDQDGYRPIPERAVKIKRRLGLLHRRILKRLFPRQAWLPVAIS
jgi:trans-aconitate methyltransferase